MRAILYKAVSESADLAEIVEGRVFQASSLGIHLPDGQIITDGVPERPFITYRMHTDFPSPMGGKIGRREYSQWWANDDPGDYLRIDEILRLIRLAVEAIPPHGSFLQAVWVETGVDLKDDAMGTINRYIRFQATGTLRERE